ncbi:8215_t:CDS:2, partial [Rhizophagus irregularis]
VAVDDDCFPTGLLYEKMADELPKDVTKWSIDDVETYLTFKMDKFDKNDIKVIKDEGVDGEGLLQLDKGIFTSEFKIKFIYAVAIMKLVKELNNKREIDASQVVNASANVTLQNTNTHGTVSSVRKIVNVNGDSQISTSLPDNFQSLLSKHLTDLEKKVVKDINNDRKLDGDNKVTPNKNPFPYFYIGTSLFELRK